MKRPLEKADNQKKRIERLEHLQREAYLLARSDIDGDHPKGVDAVRPTFSLIESMISMAYWDGYDAATAALSPQQQPRPAEAPDAPSTPLNKDNK